MTNSSKLVGARYIADQLHQTPAHIGHTLRKLADAGDPRIHLIGHSFALSVADADALIAEWQATRHRGAPPGNLNALGKVPKIGGEVDPGAYAEAVIKRSRRRRARAAQH